MAAARSEGNINALSKNTRRFQQWRGQVQAVTLRGTGIQVGFVAALQSEEEAYVGALLHGHEDCAHEIPTAILCSDTIIL